MKVYFESSPDPRVREFNELVGREFPNFLTETSPEVILVAGGDGALHHATKQFASFSGVYFGKAMGTLNFLMNEIEDDRAVLHGLANDTLRLHAIATATIDVHLNGTLLGSAANDLVLGDSVNGYHTFTLSTNDESFDNFTLKGTGVCLSTPLGSTGYNFNNGGVILPLESNMWSLTGIVCNKRINDILKAQTTSIWASGGDLFLDGINAGALANQDTVTLSPGKPIKIGFLDRQHFMSKRIELAHRMRKGVI
jgi:NAD kinase